MAQYKNSYLIFVSGMKEGRCQRAHESFIVGAKTEKQALEILKNNYNKTLKYSVVRKNPTDFGVPIGQFIKRN